MMKILFSLLAVSMLFVGCGSKSANDYINEAEEHVKQNQIPEALTAYETVIKEFPEDENASEAMYQMGAIYQNKMIVGLSEIQSQEKAVEIYRNVYEKYPQSDRAPNSLFLSGFIQANQLGKYSEATETYNLFLEKYPQHELASSAKEELEYMGLTPEEILSNKNETEI